MPEFNPEHETILHKMVKDLPNVEEGKMFGYPGYKVNGKLAVGVRGEGIIVKVGKARAKELIGKPGIAKFEPLPGRPWGDYVLISSDFDQYKDLFKEAVQYVLKETS